MFGQWRMLGNSFLSELLGPEPQPCVGHGCAQWWQNPGPEAPCWTAEWEVGTGISPHMGS